MFGIAFDFKYIGLILFCMKKTLFIAIVAALFGALTAYVVVEERFKALETATVITPDGSHYRTVNLTQTDYPDLTFAAESSVDAVVYVKVTVRQRYQNIDPILRYFFGFGDSIQREREGSGSGVIIRPDGYIVTNNHVIASASKIEVTLNNNETYEATLIGTDPATDVALLKINASNLPSLEFGNSDELRLGEWVLAIGSPLGEQLRGTITAGIVSAKGRSMPSEGEFKIESFIQTDAAVNPGNSGGALVSKKGDLVGINTAIISQTGAYSGYSFAVPSSIVKRIVDDLIEYGAVKRAKLGLVMATVNDKIAKDLKLSDTKGVYIDEVLKGGAADKAGIRRDDVIIAIDGVDILSSSSLLEKVNGFHPGDKAKFMIFRKGQKIEVEVNFPEENIKNI
jgi:Trypsin-like serine proteases, typically periplasmic, contain C-terminal PDZ domain